MRIRDCCRRFTEPFDPLPGASITCHCGTVWTAGTHTGGTSWFTPVERTTSNQQRVTP